MGKKKVLLIILSLAVVVGVIWYVSATQWTRDFEIRYVDYVGDTAKGNLSGSSYYLYEITNKTNHTLRDVDVIISVDCRSGDFEYEDYVSYSMKPGETVEYRLYADDYREVAEERDIELGFLSVSSVDITKIEYSK